MMLMLLSVVRNAFIAVRVHTNVPWEMRVSVKIDLNSFIKITVYAMPSTFLLTRRHVFTSLVAAPVVQVLQAKPVAAKAVMPLVPKIVELSASPASTASIAALSTSYYLNQSLQLGEMATHMLQREDVDGFYQRTFLSKLLEAYDASVQLIEDDFIRTIMKRGLAHPMSPEAEEEESGRFV
jgi:hypothetical protein